MLEHEKYLHTILAPIFNTKAQLRKLCDNVDNWDINFEGELKTDIEPINILLEIIEKIRSNHESVFEALTNSAIKTYKSNPSFRFLKEIMDLSAKECFSNHELHLRLAEEIQVDPTTLRNLKSKAETIEVRKHLSLELAFLAKQEKYDEKIEEAAEKFLGVKRKTLI